MDFHIHVYYDDIQIRYSFGLKNIIQAGEKINRGLRSTHQWTERKGVSVKISRTKAIILKI